MKKILLLTLLICFNTFSQNVSDKLIFKNHIQASEGYNDTYQLYTVIFLENEGSEKLEEICITGSELIFSLLDEWNLNFEDHNKLMRKLRLKKNRTFQIKSEKNFHKIRQITYSDSELEDFRQKVKFDSILQNIQNIENWTFSTGNEKEQRMMAHLLFNNGILTGVNECFGGEPLQLFKGY